MAETDTKKPAHLAFISKANQSQFDYLCLCYSADDGRNIDLQHCSGWAFAHGGSLDNVLLLSCEISEEPLQSSPLSPPNCVRLAP